MRRLSNDELNERLLSRGKHIRVISDGPDKDTSMCTCLDCNQIFPKNRKGLFSKLSGCPVCKGYQVVKGYNDFATTAPWMMDYLVNKEDGYTHTCASEDTVLVKCPDCGFERTMIIGNLYKRGFSCPCQGNFGHTVTGVNDITTVAPWMVQYFVDPINASKYAPHSFKECEFQCPECKTVIIRKIQHVYRNGLCCPACSDGVSYPNKVLRYFLMSVNVQNLEFEYIRPWTNTRFYDAYFELDSKPYLVEMDSGLHFKASYDKSLEEIQANDLYKDQLAKEKGIDLIRVKFQESDLESIISGIRDTTLSKLFDINSFDWEAIDKLSTSSLVIKVCEEYNYNKLLAKEIASKYGISVGTMCRYIARGKELGLCGLTMSSQKRAQMIKRMRNC